MKIPYLNGWIRLGLLISALWCIAVFTTLVTGLGLFRFFGLIPWLFDWVDAGTPEGPVAGLVWSHLAVLLFGPIAAIWLIGICWAWVQAGFSIVRGARYLTGERLADVLALIQVLALDQFRHRSEDGLSTELQGPPTSAASWRAIGIEHAEFFRVSQGATHQVSLLARHVAPRDGEEVLPSDYTSSLMKLAVDLHDRQLRRVQAWHVLIPIMVAIVAGAISLIGIALEFPQFPGHIH